MAIDILNNETSTVHQRVCQETAIIVAMATRIYEVGATYRPVEPDMYEVMPDNGDATIMSAHQFRTTLSLVQSMKSTTTLPVY